MSDKMTILYLGNKLEKHGRTPTSIDTLSPQLEGFLDVITASDKLNIIARFFDMIWKLLKNRHKVDAVLIDTYSTFNFYYVFIVSLLLRFLGIPYYPYLHGGNLPSRLKNSPKISQAIFKNASLNIAPSAYLQEVFRSQGYTSTFIPNNIDINSYIYHQRTIISPKFIYVRAFSKIYNPQLAVKVFYKIQLEYPEAKMLMVGPDKDGTLIETKALVKDLNLEHAIEFTGKLTKKEWIERSQNYDVFLNPTSFDNQPVSIIEAMALGLIVVSTNVGGLPYLIDDTVDGYLVDPNEDEMFSHVMDILYKDKREISLQAREKALEYSWTTVEGKWKALFIKAKN